MVWFKVDDTLAWGSRGPPPPGVPAYSAAEARKAHHRDPMGRVCNMPTASKAATSRSPSVVCGVSATPVDALIARAGVSGHPVPRLSVNLGEARSARNAGSQVASHPRCRRSSAAAISAWRSH